VAESQGVEVLSEQLDLLIADAVRVAGVGELGGQVGREAQPVVDDAALVRLLYDGSPPRAWGIQVKMG